MVKASTLSRFPIQQIRRRRLSAREDWWLKHQRWRLLLGIPAGLPNAILQDLKAKARTCENHLPTIDWAIWPRKQGRVHDDYDAGLRYAADGQATNHPLKFFRKEPSELGVFLLLGYAARNLSILGYWLCVKRPAESTRGGSKAWSVSTVSKSNLQPPVSGCCAPRRFPLIWLLGIPVSGSICSSNCPAYSSWPAVRYRFLRVQRHRHPDGHLRIRSDPN